MLEEENIVCISDINWDAHQVCEQRLMKEFSAMNRVMYVERSVSFLTPLTYIGLPSTLTQLKRWIRGGIRYEDDILIVSPPPCLPLRFNPVSNRINQNILVTVLKKLLSEFNMRDPIVISFEPDSAFLRNRLGEKLFVYYCNDDHQHGKAWWNTTKAVTKAEVNLIRKSDLVLSLTEGFARTRKICNKETYIVPNGVSSDFISSAVKGEYVIPEDMIDIPRPIVGFFGVIDYRLDLLLMIRAAKTYRTASFIIVGPVLGKMEKNFYHLCKLENVYYLGSKRPEEFANYIAAMDVGLIPSIVSDRTKNVLSLKLFEYTALGKPIISTDLPELRRYREYVYISRNADEFVENILKALKQNDENKITRRIKFASKNTWRDRAEEISKIIEKTGIKLRKRRFDK